MLKVFIVFIFCVVCAMIVVNCMKKFIIIHTNVIPIDGNPLVFQNSFTIIYSSSSFKSVVRKQLCYSWTNHLNRYRNSCVKKVKERTPKSLDRACLEIFRSYLFFFKGTSSKFKV